MARPFKLEIQESAEELAERMRASRSVQQKERLQNGAWTLKKLGARMMALMNCLVPGQTLRYFCQDESRFGLKTLTGKVITARGVKPIVPVQWERDNFWLYGVVEREIGGISQRMLTKTLRDLERNGLIAGRVYPIVPPMVEYSLTLLGNNLNGVLKSLCDWFIQNFDAVEKAQFEYDQKKAESLSQDAD
jgi:DNA-binding HxlR family transcriptional regulator